VAKVKPPTLDDRLVALQAVIDEHARIFARRVPGARDLRQYLDARPSQADEELLTEPVLREIIKRVLGFGTGEVLEQLGASGRKPDFTPADLIAHSFVFDAKSSDENLARHESQIRGYMDQRRLDYGILFNLREVRVFRRGGQGHDPTLSFPILPLWQEARGEALPGEEYQRFLDFCSHFSYRSVTLQEKARYIAQQEPWSQRLALGESVEIDVEALVERLRRLSTELAEDAGAQVEQLETYVAFDESRARSLQEELELLAEDLAPGTNPETLPTTIEAWRGATGVVAAVWNRYLQRVAYLTLARILLYRAWEDVEFTRSYLYDGGFEQWYDEFDGNARALLDEAFAHGAQRYSWLFGRENNYAWYRPREQAVVDVLYALAPEPLGKLDADVLGSLYATYAQDIDRDRLGQFFTPREVVRFMLDRVGFSGSDAVFRVEGDVRKPRRILDFATGSGGFVVESARRIIDAVGAEQADASALREALEAIVRGLAGGEISPFPYYLTEINLLLQVSRVLGPLHASHQDPPPFGALGVLPIDTLTTKRSADQSLELDPELRADRAEAVADDRFGLVPLDADKRRIYRDRLRPDESFDLVVGNPPYVSEANNKPLFDRLRAIPAWRGIYRGKTDYLYYFLWLAVEKLALGGRLCVITPAGWMNAGVANFLREKLASELTLEQLFLFGGYRLFATTDAAPTPTVESAILVATKKPAPKGHKVRIVALENESEAPRDRQELLDEMARRLTTTSGRRRGIHAHSLLQSSLSADWPWPVKFGPRDTATRVVAHLDRLTKEGRAEPLGQAAKITMGIETGADEYTARIRKRLQSSVRQQFDSRGVIVGTPILQLPAGAELREPWRSHEDLLIRAPEAEAILYGALDETNYVSYIRLTAEQPPSAVLAELDVWRPVLSSRAEIVRNQRRRWWETVWPRRMADLRAPKIIGLHRTDRGRFSLDEVGEWGAGKNAVIVVPFSEGDVAYLCGILNSELIDLWYALRGRRPRDIWRDYEPLRMKRIPYRPSADDVRAINVAQLVRALRTNRGELLPHRNAFNNLDRLSKDPWRVEPFSPNERAIAAELPIEQTVSVRLDSALEKDITRPSRARVTRSADGALVLRRGRTAVGEIRGESARIDLLQHILGSEVDETVLERVLPKDISRFRELVDKRRRLVKGLLQEGRRLVEDIERLVCAIYEVPPDLADEVVAHAVRRAGATSSKT
jgi:N-6 DNA Methylase/Eco57I restriction-modification methylase